MKRRDFLRSGASSILSLPMALNGVAVGVLHNTVLDYVLNNDDDRVFVLIQMNGGNDGLNMVVPLDHYDILMGLRSNIMVPQASLHKLTDTASLHPSMIGIKDLFDGGRVNIIQSVGYENQNRSHFRSTDIWDTGSQAQEVLTSGWIGRFLDMRHAGYPDGYPNDSDPHPIAITLGPSVSETCQGMAANFSLAIQSADSLRKIPEDTNNTLPDGPYGQELKYIRQIKDQTNKYADILVQAAEKGTNLSERYPDAAQNPLSEQLKVVASLISGGLQTRIYVVNINGFDTHANQVIPENPEQGEHAVLLSWLSSAVDAFMDDIKLLGLSKRVLAATRSEFGRKIISNGGFGTDHGNAAPLMVFGECVNAGILGDSPAIDNEVDTRDGVPAQYDFKNVFGSILQDWLGASSTEVASIFSHQFQHLPIINGCDAITHTKTPIVQYNQVKAYPNPFTDRLVLDFQSSGGPVKFELYSSKGLLSNTLVNESYSIGKQQIELNIPDLPPGIYHYRFMQNSATQSGQLVHF